MDRKDIIYYSPRCPYSMDFVNKLRSQPNNSASTVLVNIDRQRPVHPISQTPSVVSNNQIYGGSAAFQWLKGSRGGSTSSGRKGSTSGRSGAGDELFAPMTTSSFTSPSPGLTFTPYDEEPDGMLVQSAFDDFEK